MHGDALRCDALRGDVLLGDAFLGDTLHGDELRGHTFFDGDTLHAGALHGGALAAFKYLDDSAMGVDLTVKQIVHVVRGRRKVLRWLGNPPKRRGRIAKFFFRIGVTNKWTRIVLSYRVSV